MKTIRKEWPRVRQYVKAGNTYFSVDLRHIMGNSPSVIERFYKGAISPKVVQMFWSLTPTLVKNVGVKGLLKDLVIP